MSGRAVGECALTLAIHAVPDREVHPVVAVHLKHVVKGAQHRRWTGEVDLRYAALTEHIQASDGGQGRPHSVAGHVDQMEADLVWCDPLESKASPPSWADGT